MEGLEYEEGEEWVNDESPDDWVGRTEGEREDVSEKEEGDLEGYEWLGKSGDKGGHGEVGEERVDARITD